MFADLPKSSRMKTDRNSSRNDVNKARWTAEEVTYYYGEWIGNEHSAELIMRTVARKTEGFYKLAFTHRMNLVRDYLVYELGFKDVSFIPNYRRIKND